MIHQDTVITTTRFVTANRLRVGDVLKFSSFKIEKIDKSEDTLTTIKTKYSEISIKGFLLSNSCWVSAEKLKVGDKVLTTNGEEEIIEISQTQAPTINFQGEFIGNTFYGKN